MELYRDMIQKILETHPETISVDTDKIKEIFDSECYKALEKIRAVLKDDSLNDKECFNKIEAIVCVFEDLGSGCATRHDFG